MRGIKQTAGRDRLGQFAPDFAQLNDDVLFGQIWADESLDLKTRSTIVICVFMGRGLVDDSLRYHLETAKKNGITREEISAIITQAAFYAGWPVAWAVFLWHRMYGQTLTSPILNEPLIVGRNNERPFPRLHSCFQGFNRIEIEIVRRLIDKQYCRRARKSQS